MGYRAKSQVQQPKPKLRSLRSKAKSLKAMSLKLGVFRKATQSVPMHLDASEVCGGPSMAKQAWCAKDQGGSSTATWIDGCLWIVCEASYLQGGGYSLHKCGFSLCIRLASF